MTAAMAMQSVAYARHPVAGDVWRDVMPLGLSLMEIAARVPGLPEGFERHGVIMVDGEVIERWQRVNGRLTDVWAIMRPKPGPDGSCRVTLHLSLHGRGLRSVLAIVASIALVAATTFIASGGLAGLFAGGLFTAGSTSATLLAAAVGVLGRFALTALAPPAAKEKDNSANALGNAGADGNLLQPGGPIPRVCGTVKIYPPLAARPLVDLAGDDEFVEAAYVLAGPHLMEDPRAENARLTDIDGLQFITHDGTAAAPPNLLSRYGNQRIVQFELQAHLRDQEDAYKLRRQDDPESCEPAWRTEVSGLDPDELWFHLLWPQGMGKQSGTILAGMPVRLRMREIGTEAWINLPELHFWHKKIGAIRKFIKLKWGTPGTISDLPQDYGASYAFHTVPASGAAPVGRGGWTAHSSFVGTAGNYAATARVERAYDGFTVWLDPAVFQRGKIWEVQVRRGCLYLGSQLIPSSYGYWAGAAAADFFGYFFSGGENRVPTAGFYDETIIEACTLTRFASVWNRPPLPRPGHAKLELRAKNIQAQRVSVRASGLIPLWDGTEWSGLGASSNPADHYRAVLAGALSRDPAFAEEIDEASILAFRAHCASLGYRVAAAFDGRSWRETLAAIAACGKGQRKEGGRFGVVFERDRSAEGASQTLSGRVASNIQMIKAFDDAPQAFRVTFRNEAKDWEPDERLVIRPGLAIEDVTDVIPADAVGVTTAAQVDQLFGLDLKLAWHRDYIVECDVHVQSLVAERGDLVRLSHTILSRHHRWARVAAVERDGSGHVTTITIDARKAITGEGDIEDVTAIEGVSEIGELGVAMAVAIRTGANVEVTAPLANAPAAQETRLVLASPLASADVKPGDPVVIGPATQVSERFLVADIRPSRLFNARLTLLPETPEAFL